jgi:hypothetical protein
LELWGGVALYQHYYDDTYNHRLGEKKEKRKRRIDG